MVECGVACQSGFSVRPITQALRRRFSPSSLCTAVTVLGFSFWITQNFGGGEGFRRRGRRLSGRQLWRGRGFQTIDGECNPTPPAIEKPAIVGDMKEPCVVCLGALHLLVDDSAILQQIEDVVRKDGYVFDKFCLEVSIPAVSVVREWSLWFYLKENYPEETRFSSQVETSSIVSLKEAIKWSLIAPLESKLAAKFDANALLRIALLYKHSTSLTDLNFIHHSSGDAKRRRNGYEAKAPVAGLAAVAAERAAEAGESVAAVTRALAAMTSKTFSRHFPSPPPQLILRCCRGCRHCR